MIPNLTTKADLQRLVDDKLQESLTLDYKASPALDKSDHSRTELCKDVSAMANSAGGQIIYGVEEDRKTRKPSRVDEGVEESVISKEWIEDVIGSRIQPRIEGLLITQIPFSDGRVGYVIAVPQSLGRGAHQAPDKKYYKRFNFKSEPMEDYEVRDVMRRASSAQLKLGFAFSDQKTSQTLDYRPGVDGSEPVRINVSVENTSDTPAPYGVVRVYIETKLKLFSAQNFQNDGNAKIGDDHLYVLTYIFGPPQTLPVFKENPVRLGWFDVGTQPWIRDSEGLRPVLAYEVRTPGFREIKSGRMEVRGSRLILPTDDAWSNL